MIDGNEAERLIMEAIAEIRQPVRSALGYRRGPLKRGSEGMGIVQNKANREIGLLIAVDIIRRLRRTTKRRQQPQER